MEARFGGLFFWLVAELREGLMGQWPSSAMSRRSTLRLESTTISGFQERQFNATSRERDC